MTSGNFITNKGGRHLRPVGTNILLEGGGFVGGEITAMATGLGVVALIDVVPKSVREKATGIISKIFVEPHLDAIEHNLAKCRLKECQVDETKSREERAHRLADGIFVFGTAYLASLAAKFAARNAFNDWAKVTKTQVPKSNTLYGKIKPYIPIVGSSRDANIITLADESVHIGSLIYLNTEKSKFTDEHINKLTNTLEKFGVGHEKAKDISTMIMVWEVPNALGMLSGGAAIVGKHTKGWGLDNYPKHKIMDVINGTAKVPTRV